MSTYLGGVTIIISCLGLAGLAFFTAEKRQKEIGIRKVLGSTKSSIVLLLSKEFLSLVVVAVLVALPLSYVLANYWLMQFAYRIELHWWHFAGASTIALSIAWLTVGTTALKAAKASPAMTLKEQ